jgi:hypothetical protein
VGQFSTGDPGQFCTGGNSGYLGDDQSILAQYNQAAEPATRAKASPLQTAYPRC